MRTYFYHEKLDVYQLELRFIEWAVALLGKTKQRPTEARTAEVSDQPDRASLSALLNTAEGNGRRQRGTRAKFFDDARGSVTERAAYLNALVAKNVSTPADSAEGKQLLLRIASMLTKLIARFDSSSIIREEPESEAFDDDYDYENEEEGKL
jgi:four helix bundle protein